MVAINTNVPAIIAENALTVNEREMTSAMERLSTGKRINSASDDAAGLAIASRMSSQIAGLNQASRNANDGVSMIQTAESAYVEVSDMLQRMREIAVQSASETYATADRAALDLEFQALQDEIVRISDQTTWNGFNILDGSVGTSGTVKIQSGSNASQTVDVDFGTLSRTITTGTVADTSDTVQTVTLGADIAEEDILTFKINDSAFISAVSVTLSADDVGRLNGTTAEELDGDVVFQATDASGATVTLGGVTVTIEGTGTEKEFTVTLGSGHADFAVTDVRVSRGGGTIEALEMNSVRTQAFANAAITALDTAMGSVNTQRASYGSYISRLEHASTNLANVAQNMDASRSRIQDADYARETTELARTQIIQQAATAMLAQANAVKRTVLALLS